VKVAMKQTGRMATVILSIFAWLAISNHCALAGIEAAATQASIPKCHHCADSTPAKEKQTGAKTVCCKVLRATLHTQAKKIVGVGSTIFVLQTHFLSAVFGSEAAKAFVFPMELDTGPPFRVSFAESVLQRSILSHAPPLSA
jgi:hypothetical protein